jgi:hypothetical protein
MDDKPTIAELVKKPRRWFSFSLRTLLIVVTLVGCGMGWVGMKVQEARRQQAAVRAIEDLGGEVQYDYEFDSKGGALPNPALPGPAWLHFLLGDDFFRDAHDVLLLGPQVTDTSLEHLRWLTKLQSLCLNVAHVTDAGLERLKGLTQLRGLDLRHTDVTDAGLEQLKSLTQLEELFLNDTEVTDTGVAKLQQALPNCQIYL